MKTVELIAPCHFGLEAVLKREILDLGYEIVKVEDGRITFRTDLDGIARANIFLRTAERILLKIGSFKAYTFDDLFEGTKKLPWEDYIPENGRFWVKKASPSSLNHDTLYLDFIRSTIAFLTIDWISGALNNLLFAVDAFFTQKRPFSGI